MARGRYLIPATDQPRVRRASDATVIVIGLLVLLLSWRSYRRTPDPDAALDQFTEWIPSWLNGTLSVFYLLGILFVMSIFVALLFQWRSRLDVIRDQFLALVAVMLLSTFLVRAITGTWPRVLNELGLAEAIAQFPIFRVASVTAGLLVISPHLTRPMRRAALGAIFLVAVAGVGLGLGLPSSAIGAVALGAAASGAVLLVFGSPRGYPDVESISSALMGLGLNVSGLSLDDDQSWGVRRLTGEADGLGRVEVKAYGRDATDSQVASRAWRYLWYRDTEPQLALSRMQSVEHEALVTMMAAKTRVPVPDVLAAGSGEDDLALLAVDTTGDPLSAAEPTEVEEAFLADIWASVRLLHEASISHGSLTCDSVLKDGPNHLIRDFGSGTLAAGEAAQALDVVELLVSMSERFGRARTVAAAMTGLGVERLGAALPYVQVPAVSARQRRALAKPKDTVKQIARAVAEATGTEIEEVAQIRRVRAKNVAMTAVTLFAVYFLISQLSDIDFVAVWQEVQNADWAWFLIAFIVGQVVYLPQATAMLAAVGHPIPLFPATVLQSSIMFIALAVPSSAGRIAMIATFLRRYGISVSSAFIQSSLDTIAGLLVEVTILVLAVLTGVLDLGFSDSDTNWGQILLVLTAVVLLVLLLLRRVKKLREWIMPIVGEAFSLLRDVLRDPRRTLLLMGSNFGSRFVFAVSLWLILQGLGVTIGLWSVLTVTVAAGLLGGVMPVPGGVGVTEAIITGFLVLFGVPETPAFAAAVIYRILTFYIPSAGGFFSMRWLEKNGYL